MPDEILLDPEARLFARLAASLEGEYRDDADLWAESPFRWIKNLSSPKQRGTIAERLVQLWCQAKGIPVSKSPDSDADLLIHRRRVEVKSSSLWKDSKIYKFQQIRDQNYDFCLCLGFSPSEVHAWFIPKQELMIVRRPELVRQHGGSSGRDTKWLSFPANSPPGWLTPFGGTLAQVHELIRETAR